jgi:porin
MSEALGRGGAIARAVICSRRRIIFPLVFVVLLPLCNKGAIAQENPPPVNGIPSPSIATSLPANGDPGGMRWRLSEVGVTYGFIYTSEVIGNTTGGLRRGAIFEGLLEAYVEADLEKLAGFRGLSFFSNSFQIHGQGGPGNTLVGNMATISDIEALPSTRLSEIWLEQKLLGGAMSIRAGQLVADTEFLVSQYFGLFISKDWPTITSEDLPSGGPAYPLSTPGVRLRIDPTKETSFLLALFNGDPAGPGLGDPQLRDRYGLNFRLRAPPFMIGELQYRYNQDKFSTGLAGGVRIGAWHHFDRFDDLRFDIYGMSLANPLSAGVPKRWQGESGIYAVIDQQLYRPTGGDANSGIAIFSRIAGAQPDQSLIDFYLDGGIVFTGLIPGRPKDAFGGAFIYSHISNRASALDCDRNFFSASLPQPVRDYELSLEFTYRAEIVQGWTLQPDLQFAFHPGGNAPNPNDPTGLTPIRNATLLGLRTTIQY